MTYREERGWGFQSNTPASNPNEASLAQLQSELSALQNEVRSLKGDTANGGQD